MIRCNNIEVGILGTWDHFFTSHPHRDRAATIHETGDVSVINCCYVLYIDRGAKQVKLVLRLKLPEQHQEIRCLSCVEALNSSRE